MSRNPTIISVSVSALTAAGLTLLAARPDHDLYRSAGAVGVLIGAVGAATAIHWTLMDRRLRRVEGLGERIVTCERDVLSVLQGDGGSPHPVLR